MQLLHEKKQGQQTLGYLHSKFSIKVTGLFSYVTLVTEGALVIFFPRKTAGGACRRKGPKWSEHGIYIFTTYLFIYVFDNRSGNTPILSC